MLSVDHPSRKIKFTDNPDFAHVHYAMKLARQELDKAIENTDPVYFDATPIDYKNLGNTAVVR